MAREGMGPFKFIPNPRRYACDSLTRCELRPKILACAVGLASFFEFVGAWRDSDSIPSLEDSYPLLPIEDNRKRTEMAASSYLRRVAEADVSANSTMTEIDEFVEAGQMSFNNTTEQGMIEFDPKVFWSVNGFIFCLFTAMVLYCIYGDTSFFTNIQARQEDSDRVYQATLREREERRRQANMENPQQRRRRLLQSFRRHKVTMIVEEKDFIPEQKDYDSIEKDNVCNEIGESGASSQDVADSQTSVASFGNNGYLKLPTQAHVPNCCAICLGDYEVGDTVVWSSNQECPHAYHQECICDWLVKMQPATPCPLCRNEFTDLERVKNESKITWAPSDAFNFRAIAWR